jgi:TatD DNase family protein
MDILRATPVPRRGFLLHSWNGPVELVPELVRLGAYFSFSAHHLRPTKADLRAQFASAIPSDRVLVETDAPALCPAPEHRRHALPPDAAGVEQNHPANLLVNLEELARTRGLRPEQAAELTRVNFTRLFLGQ